MCVCIDVVYRYVCVRACASVSVSAVVDCSLPNEKEGVVVKWSLNRSPVN
jgi:hypothetical protein